MKILKNLVCRIIGHKIFEDSGRECCLRCKQDSFYNVYFYYTVPNLILNSIESIKDRIKSIKTKKDNLPF